MTLKKMTTQKSIFVGGLKTYIKFDYHMMDGTFSAPIQNLFDVFLVLLQLHSNKIEYFQIAT